LRYRALCAGFAVGCLVALACSARPEDTPRDWALEFQKARDLPPEEQVEILREFAFSNTADANPNLESYVDEVIASRDRANYPIACERLAVALALIAKGQSAPPAGDASEKARRILSEPHFRRIGEEKSGNWLRRAFESIQSAPLPDREPARIETQTAGPVRLDGFFYFVIAVLGIGAAVALAHLILHWRWKRSRKAATRKPRGGLLEEGEELLSTDEWLDRARALEAKGEYREAVRCLYLAMLMRLDEAGLVQFDRYETNWEHLRRIERASVPEGVPYRWLTQQFDFVWYGEREATPELCARFRQEYEKMMSGLKEGATL